MPVAAGPTTYYYFDGVFYVQQGSAFVVVNAPIGIVVPLLPSAATQVVVNGNVYYQLGGVYYQPFFQGDTTVYRIVTQ